ncbi:MAG: hypothetical protein MJZ19_07155 [Paludibacteraceae bacterium]|nr:hypothetical protein [Paludibacteraceae bacterium]
MKIIDFNKTISIPQKEVLEQKNYLQRFLNKIYDCDIVSEMTFPWMQAPYEMDDLFCRVFQALSQYRNADPKFARVNYKLRCDFVCESQKTIIEYDERQHFSEARAISLEAYRDIPLNYDRNLWIKACRDIKARDKDPVYRDEGRAFFDSTRDIQAYRNGYKLVRIMHGQIDFTKDYAYNELIKLLDL